MFLKKMGDKNPLRGEERRVISTKLYRSEFANLAKVCEKEGKSVHTKLREMVQHEIENKIASIKENEKYG
jgi:hypothetical protein